MITIILPVFILIFTFVAYKLFECYQKQKHLHTVLAKFPSDTWYPFVGTGYTFWVKREDTWDTYKALYKKHGPTFVFWMHWTYPMLFISKPEHCEVIFKNTHNNLDKGPNYKMFEPWLGKGLITAEGQLWKHKRRLLTPAFHFKVLDKYSEVFYRSAEKLAKIFEEKSKSEKGFFEVTHYISKCAQDIIAETAMGVQFNALETMKSDYGTAINVVCDGCTRRAENFLYAFDFIFNMTKLGKQTNEKVKFLRDTNMKIITDRKKKIQNEKKENIIDDTGVKKKLAFLDILLASQDETQLSDDDICDEVSTFMFAGQDTTTTTVTYALLALGSYPELQEKVHEELDAIFGDSDRPITPQDVAEMHYLEMFVKEVLRKFSIVPAISRLLDQEVVIDGVTIPPNVEVFADLYQLHHRPDHWPDPDKFDPDRFLPENATGRHPYAFAPFSAGARNCIGQKFGTRNSKTMLSTLLRKFKITSQEHPDTLKEYNEVVLRPQNGLHLKFELKGK